MRDSNRRCAFDLSLRWQATCRDLECCHHHCPWGWNTDIHSKDFKSKRVARIAARVQERGPKDHLPRAGRCTYVQLSSQEEGKGPWWTTDNSWQRGVYKWFKRMRAEVTDSPTDSR